MQFLTDKILDFSTISYIWARVFFITVDVLEFLYNAQVSYPCFALHLDKMSKLDVNVIVASLHIHGAYSARLNHYNKSGLACLLCF